MYGIVLRLPILALNLTQDGSRGQRTGPGAESSWMQRQFGINRANRETKDRVEPYSAVHFHLRARKGPQIAPLYHHPMMQEDSPVSLGDRNRITLMSRLNHLQRSGARYPEPHY